MLVSQSLRNANSKAVHSMSNIFVNIFYKTYVSRRLSLIGPNEKSMQIMIFIHTSLYIKISLFQKDISTRV